MLSFIQKHLSGLIILPNNYKYVNSKELLLQFGNNKENELQSIFDDIGMQCERIDLVEHQRVGGFYRVFFKDNSIAALFKIFENPIITYIDCKYEVTQ